MLLLHRLGTSLTVVLLSTLLLWALGSSAGVRPTDATTGGARASTGRDRPDPLGVELPGSWRPGVVPAVHAVEPSVLRPVPRTAPPTPGTTVGDIPSPALAAYQRAASVLAGADASCRLPWTLLAGIGRVESDHGRAGGARLDEDGVSHPRVLGVALDGAGPVAAVRDTDGGTLDGDPVWDRAVGPLQFIPSTWATVGVDADGDGRRSPDDIDDAALGAAVYLCAGASGLDVRGHARAALLRYNASPAYAALVLAYAESYRADAAGPPPRLVATETIVPTAHQVDLDDPAAGAAGSAGTRGEHGAPSGSAPGHGGSAAPGDPQPGSTPPSAPTSHHPPTHPSAPPTAPPGGSPAPPTPEDPPAADVPLDPPATAEPLVPQVVEGTWTACETGSCLDGRPLGLTVPDPTCQVADYDGDGGTEPLEAELAGLQDRVVAVTVLEDPNAWVVLEIGGLPWPGAEAGCTAEVPGPTDPAAGS